MSHLHLDPWLERPRSLLRLSRGRRGRQGRLPGISARCLRAEACLYTVTPDFRFVIDEHPDSARIIVASPCSGHGFKHSAAIGESIAAWLMTGKRRIGLVPFPLAHTRRVKP